MRVPKNSKERDKKAFFSDQCKAIDKNNRTAKTRDLFRKIRDTTGTFHAKMGTIMDRNVMNTQKNCTKKIFTTQIIMMV